VSTLYYVGLDLQRFTCLTENKENILTALILTTLTNRFLKISFMLLLLVVWFNDCFMSLFSIFFQLQRSFCFVLVFRSDMSESDVVLSWSELNCSSDYSITILHRCVGLTTTVGYFKLVLNWTLGEYKALKVCFSCIFADHFSSPVMSNRSAECVCVSERLSGQVICPDSGEQMADLPGPNRAVRYLRCRATLLTFIIWNNLCDLVYQPTTKTYRS